MFLRNLGGALGMDCYADDRDVFNDFAKYFNNQHLSDVTLKVGEERFYTLRICQNEQDI
jgi:hypothetical protein